MWEPSSEATAACCPSRADGLATVMISCYRRVTGLTRSESTIGEALGQSGTFAVTSRPLRVLEGICCRLRHDPAKSDRRKVELRNLVKRLAKALCVHSGEEVLFSLPRISGSVVGLVYGPRVETQVTTYSHDLLTLVTLKDELKPREICRDVPLVLESIDRIRVILIDCNLKPLEAHHREVISHFLCNGLVKRDLYPVERGAIAAPLPIPPASISISPGKDDQVAVYVGGSYLSTGRGDEFFRNLGPSITYEDSNSRKICVPVSHDWWNIRVDSIGPDPRLAVDFFTHIRTVSRFGNADSRSACQLDQVYFLDSVVADHVCCLGRIFPWPRDPSCHVSKRHDQLTRLRLSRDISIVRNSGCPLVEGFLRVLGMWEAERVVSSPVVTYESYLFAERGTLRSSSDDRPPLCPDLRTGRAQIFALGDFSLTSPPTELEFSHFESGKDIHGVRATLTYFLGRVDNRLVAGLSNCSGSSSNLQKLASLSGANGVIISTQFGPCNRDRRGERDEVSTIDLKRFLTASHPVVYIAIYSCPHMLTEAILSEVASHCQCLCTYVGYLDDSTSGIVFKAGGDPDSSPGPGDGSIVASFRKTKRRYHLPLEGSSLAPTSPSILDDGGDLQAVLINILQHPTVGSKEFICKHTDRVSTGQIIRNPGVGPYDIPVGDYLAICHKLTPFDVFDLACWDMDTPGMGARRVFSEHPLTGICTAIGERTQLFWNLPHLGVKVAIAEAVLNICGANIQALSAVTISVQFTWPHVEGFQAELDSVMTTASHFAAELGVSFYIEGANSSTMGLEAQETSDRICIRSCVARATAPSPDLSKGLTPALVMDDSYLLLISACPEQLYYATVAQQLGHNSNVMFDESDLRASSISSLFALVLALRERHLVWSIHDVSDGGVWCTLCEMAIAGGKSLDISIPASVDARIFLTSETPGVVVEVSQACLVTVLNLACAAGLHAVQVATIRPQSGGGHSLSVIWGSTSLFTVSIREVYEAWSDFSLRYLLDESADPSTVPLDLPFCNFPGLTFTPFSLTLSPDGLLKVWVLTLPGAFQPIALMAALVQSGFMPVHVPLGAIAEVDCALDVAGICVCGQTGVADHSLGEKALTFLTGHTGVIRHGFDFVLNDRKMWSLSLGPAACELMAGLRAFGYNSPSKTSVHCINNKSGLFESRWLNFFIPSHTRAIGLRSLRGSLLPCWIQGSRLGFDHKHRLIFDRMMADGQVAACFWGSKGQDGEALTYPRNPTAGPTSMAGLCSRDGRHLGLLFDPSLAFHLGQWSYVPGNMDNLFASPWKTLFYDLYEFSSAGVECSVLPRTEDVVYSQPLE